MMVGNIKAEQIGNSSVKIEIECDKTNVQSKTGKSRILASTGGFIMVGDMQLSLNLIRKHKSETTI